MFNRALSHSDQGGWTVEEYLRLDPGRHVEFSNGYLELQPMPDDRHQAILGLLFVLLHDVAQAFGGRARFAPLPVRLRDEKFREPDLCFMRKENLSRCRDVYWEGADLVIEVVSPSDPKHDLVTKRSEYAQAGIPEYWIVDPRERTITVLVLSGEVYVEALVGGDGAYVASRCLPQFEVDVTGVFDAV